MPEWIIAGACGAAVGTAVGALIAMFQRWRKPIPATRRVAIPVDDKSPAAILSGLYGCLKESITVRPLLPSDLNKDSWTWGENERVVLPSTMLLELHGLGCSKWAAVKLYNNNIGSICIGLLTSWDDTARVIIKPNQAFYVRPIVIDTEKSEHFALRGTVCEPEGATIATW